MWGIRANVRGQRYRSRFIPTRVGNTTGSNCPHSMISVHPHACGEYYATHQMFQRWYGSSPRVWGILFRPKCRIRFVRFIPTRVGNTEDKQAGNSSVPVHPHACGEYYLWLGPLSDLGGSSPRVWGIRSGGSGATLMSRFIPTRVGNTPALISSPASIPVHPHACGEYTFTGTITTNQTGSSPRVWGIHA